MPDSTATQDSSRPFDVKRSPEIARGSDEPVPSGHVARALAALVRAYQRWVSPLFPARCKYHPTCSAYAAQAIRELGAVRGTVVAAWRLARCNPFSHGGHDPLSARRLFRESEAAR